MIEQALDFKLAVAKSLGMFLKPSDEESAIIANRMQIANKEKSEVAKKEAAEKLAEHQKSVAERRAKRQARIDEIMARPKVIAWNEAGVKLTGIPVDKKEWQILPERTPVVLIEQDLPIQAFKVGKNDSGAIKFAIHKVFAQSPVKSVSDVDASDIIKVTAKDKKTGIVITRDDVPVYADMDEIRVLQSRGLNSGTWVAIPDSRHPEKRFQILSIFTDHIDTIGVVQRKPA